ncbi:hypothetical protein GW17_00020615 [Ensete ventricosum]|nr:hypothetical protein GW17_00020615 [Ensete ventricosum]
MRHHRPCAVAARGSPAAAFSSARGDGESPCAGHTARYRYCTSNDNMLVHRYGTHDDFIKSRCISSMPFRTCYVVQIVAGRFVNVFSTNDWILGITFRAR